MDPKTGEILAMVGSVDFYDDSISGQVNLALSERQPGSSIKPITYAAAFARGMTPATIVQDRPTSFPPGIDGRPYQPKNHDDRFRGPLSIRYALAESRNVPAVSTLQQVGLQNMIDLAHEMGVTTLTEPGRYGLSLTLGGGEVKLLDMTGVYSVFATKGIKHEPTPIRKITDSKGRVLEELDPNQSKRVLDERIAYLITDVLSDDRARAATYGLNSDLKLSRPAAVKTGTTDDNRDSWTIGYTPSLVTGVWVGNSNGAPMNRVFGVSGAGRIWNRVMERAFTILEIPPERFGLPEGVSESDVCRTTAFAETAECVAWRQRGSPRT
jgi:membrane peptidoglycan carboxypeptidase